MTKPIEETAICLKSKLPKTEADTVASNGCSLGLDVYFWKLFGKSTPSFDFQCLEISLGILPAVETETPGDRNFL